MVGMNDGPLTRLDGPVIEAGVPLAPWFHMTFDFLIQWGYLEECDRAPIADTCRATYGAAGFTWGDDDDGQDRKVPPLARVNQVN